MKLTSVFSILFTLLLTSSPIYSQSITGEKREIKESIINSNNITTILYNYGSIGAPNTLGNIADLFWNNLGYMGEFGPLVSAEVIGKNGETLHITSDSFVRTGQGDYNADGTIKWGWLPRSGYADNSEGQNEIARSSIGDNNNDGKPDSWPESWYSASLGRYVWPGEYGDDVILAEDEVYYVMDDFSNAEFPYYPFPNDTTKRGLGISAEVRVYQFSGFLEDALILKYKITNESPKDLTKVYFGFQGDPHIGGPSDYADDRVDIVNTEGNSKTLTNLPLSLAQTIFNWDDDEIGSAGRPTGVLSLKLLETPNDLGLTSFHAAQYTNSEPNVPKNDELMWQWLSEETINYNQELLNYAGDNILNFGTGPFELNAGESKEIKLALILSNSIDDMISDVTNIQYYHNWPQISNSYDTSGGNNNYKIELNELSNINQDEVEISWNYTGNDPNAKVFIDYSSNGGKDWRPLTFNQDINGSFIWNTKLADDGVNYILRVLAYNPEMQVDYFYDNSNSRFTIDNPEKNSIPEFEFIQFAQPINNEKVKVKWISEDADNSELNIIVEYSTNREDSFKKIYEATHNNGENSFYWDVSSIPNSKSNFLRFTCQDDSNSALFFSDAFEVNINKASYSNTKAMHISGDGSVRISVIVADTLEITGDTYEISFNTDDDATKYSVKNTNTNEMLLSDYSGSTTPSFEGLRLEVAEIEMGIDYETTHFGRAELEPTYNVFFSQAFADYVGNPHIKTALDWIVVFNDLDTLSDGSWANVGDSTLTIPSMEYGICPFKIIDIDNNEKANYLIDETRNINGTNNRWDEGEKIVLRPQLTPQGAEVSYALDFDFSSGIIPQAGDTLYIITYNPIENDDVFQFTSDNNYVLLVESEDTKLDDFTLYQNYPNPFNPSTTIKYSIPSSTNSDFYQVKLVVFDILGREVKTLVHKEQKTGNYEVLFNASNISSGIYFYRLQSGGFSETKKMIILR